MPFNVLDFERVHQGNAVTEFEINLKRAYEPADEADGLRILVERLWPRGVTKEAVALDHWLRDIAPSNELRRWYGHKPDRWDEFQRRYQTELRANSAELQSLISLIEGKRACFVFAARDVERSGAAALKAYLEVGG